MPDADYRTALDAALREYEELTRRRAEIDERIAQLSHTIGGLTRLCGLAPAMPLGLTDACRVVLKAAGRALTAVEVRDELETIGFDVARYANDLASIHTVLKRLNQAGEARFVPRASGKSAYEWMRPVRSVVLSRAAAEHLRRGDEAPPAKAGRRGTKP